MNAYYNAIYISILFLFYDYIFTIRTLYFVSFVAMAVSSG